VTINRFGWIQPPADGRDQAYRLRAVRDQLQAAKPPVQRKRPYRDGPLLDQGNTPMCVGFSAKGLLDGAPIMSKPDGDPAPQTLYAMAQDRDEWESPPPYDGTSVRGVCKALQDLGLIEAYAWGQTTDEAVHFIEFDYGTLLSGTNWYAPMSEVDRNGYMREPPPSLATPIGGHAYRLVWFVQKADPNDSYFVVRNSWGAMFGWPDKQTGKLSGYAKMRVRLFERLQREDGELAAPTQIRLKPVKPV
jgi:hypothetical protein